MTSQDHSELRDLSDEELIDRFRAMKTEVGGADPGLTPPNGTADPVRAELERRGLAPDREDLIPDYTSPTDSPADDDA